MQTAADNMADPIKTRMALATDMDNKTTDAFPGSMAAKAYTAAMLKLDAYDREHPEAVAAIRAMSDVEMDALRCEMDS